MFAALTNIAFLSPLFLGALLALPLLYFLLRITPPQPKAIEFPAIRFLHGLVSDTQTPSSTPWWLIFLRLLIAAFLILALSHPVLNPSKDLQHDGPIRIIIDNDWKAAQNWKQIKTKAKNILDQASREQLVVYIVTTSPKPGEKNTEISGPISAAEALSYLKALAPNPWDTDYKQVVRDIKNFDAPDNLTTFFLSNGLKETSDDSLLDTITNQGRLIVVTPQDKDLPIALSSPMRNSEGLQSNIITPTNSTEGTPITLQAISDQGSVLDQQKTTTTAQSDTISISFDIPQNLQNNVHSFSIAGRSGAGSKYLLDTRFQRKSVGIIASGEDANSAPLIDKSYYIRRALEPYAQLHIGDYNDILDQAPSVVILPDIATIQTEALNKLDKWITEGGLLLRFAGTNMTSELGKPLLVPVPLRTGGRSVSGSLSWDKPLTLQSFEETSPFYGLEIPHDLTIQKQILAEPSEDLKAKSWALLSDDTPLITANKKGDGYIILIHTTATPEWSNLALSGLFVDILKRIIDIAGKAPSQIGQAQGSLEAVMTLNGYGSPEKPPATVQPIQADQLNDIKVSSIHPPGIYQRSGINFALNLGDSIGKLSPLDMLPLSVKREYFDSTYEKDLKPTLLYTAAILFLIDFCITIVLLSNLSLLTFKRSIKICLAVLCVFSTFATTINSAHAQKSAQDYSTGLYLAFIKTGDNSIDTTTRQGLDVLGKVLARRTSVEPDGVAALDPATDTLAFFPLIYWPVTTSAQKLSSKALSNIQYYLDHGGTILFDTRDQNFAARSIGGTNNADALRIMISTLNIPPLEPIPEQHVLGKSFYLLNSYPGRYTGGTLWVESQSKNGRDGVSTILIGSHDWARSWADSAGTGRNIRGSSRQEELSLRFGVNLMMYALTGNYKADQVHMPFILERIGQ